MTKAEADMNHFWSKAAGIIAMLALVVPACGGDDDDESATTSSARDLNQFLIRADELPGLSPSGEPLALSSVSDLVEEFNAPAAEEQRLREHGLQSFVNQMLVGRDAAGLSAVDVFASEDGAARELEYLLHNKENDAPAGIENFKRFDIPGVPNATGWTFDKPGGSTAADVHWTQGRCLLTLGSEPPSVDQLRIGVQALYERTGGQCP